MNERIVRILDNVTKAKSIIEESYDIPNVYQGIYLQDLVSRKKQLVPSIMEAMQKKV